MMEHPCAPPGDATHVADLLLTLPQLLPSSVSHVLYIDSDVLAVHGPIGGYARQVTCCLVCSGAPEAL